MKHKFFWGSSYDRGLDVLLYMWPDILKEYPETTLHCCYGWDMFDKAMSNNPERMEWKKTMVSAMNQKGITHHGRVNKEELKKIRSKCTIWAYPTYFTEINCITALDCQSDGVVPVTMSLAALDETVGSGIKLEGNIRDRKTAEKYLKDLLKLMGDDERWKKESKKGKKFAKKYIWDRIAMDWTKEFAKPVSEPLITIYTPTIRKGWWNIMAKNIKDQTYKNIEWIIVDDYPYNRKEIADKYVKKYNLDIKYMRGGKTDEYNFGLSSANNIAWKASNGSLIVFLQDFVLMPKDGIERLVDIHRHHPTAMIAPCDEAYAPKVEPNTDSEDWFNGETDIVGEFISKNQRIDGMGMRKTDNYLELELNYGAIPRKVLENLNGFWEFFNDGLGFDDTEIVYRAFMMGYDLIVDDTNVCKCIDHWKPLEDKQEELGKGRTHNLNDPRFVWLIQKMKEGKLGAVREEDKDKKLDYTIPPQKSKDEAVKWMLEHKKEIIRRWK